MFIESAENTWALGALWAREALQNRKHFTWALNGAAILSAEKGIGKTIPIPGNSLSKGLEACKSMVFAENWDSCPWGQSPGWASAGVRTGKIDGGHTETDFLVGGLDLTLEAGSIFRRRTPF